MHYNGIFEVTVKHTEGECLICIDANKIEKESDVKVIALYRAKTMLEMEGVESGNFEIVSIIKPDL